MMKLMGLQPLASSSSDEDLPCRLINSEDGAAVERAVRASSVDSESFMVMIFCSDWFG